MTQTTEKTLESLTAGFLIQPEMGFWLSIDTAAWSIECAPCPKDWRYLGNREMLIRIMNEAHVGLVLTNKLAAVDMTHVYLQEMVLLFGERKVKFALNLMSPGVEFSKGFTVVASAK